MREAGRAPAKPPPKAAPAPQPAQAHRTAAPEAARQLFLRGPAVDAEHQARAAGDSVARGGTAQWSGGAPIAASARPQLEAALTPEREQAPYGVIIEDGLPLGEGQIHRSDFVEQMAAEIFKLADEELASVNRRAADCPFLAHWHAYYRTKSAALIERTIRMFAEPDRTDLEGLRIALLDRVRTAARQWIMLGMPGADSASMMPPGASMPGTSSEASDTAGEALARKAESANSPPPAPGSAAAVRQQLGSGQPLDSGVRSRMERGFRTNFSDVRVHTDAHAARVASQYSARAFAVGSDVGFAPGRFRPGSLAGDALIAHELAHVVQQRGADHDAGVARSGELEQDADRAAAGLITEQETASPKGRTGLRLQLNDCCDDPEGLDWHNKDAIGYSIAAAEMQRLREEQQKLLAQPGMDPARAARLAEIDAQMQALALSIQGLGVQGSTSDIISGVLGNQDLRKVTVTELRGAEEAKVYFGEQREFQLRLGYLPRTTEVMIIWCYTAGRGVYVVSKKEYRQGGDVLKLDGTFWAEYGEFGPRDNEAGGHKNNPGFTIMAKVVVGGQEPPETEAVTPWMTVEQRMPDDVSIQVLQIDQHPTVSAAPAAPTAGSSTSQASARPAAGSSASDEADLQKLVTGHTAAKSSGEDVILEGARIDYRLSWFAPVMYGQNPRYAMIWQFDRIQDGGKRTKVERFGPGPLWGVTGPLNGPGDYEVRVDIVSRQPFEHKGAFGTTSLKSATRKLKVLSSADVGSRALATYAAHGGPPQYEAFVADLDKQIADLETTLASGSAMPGAMKSQIGQLKQMRERLVAQMGGNTDTPFPQDGKFLDHLTYATPLTAVMVHPEHAGAVPMSIFLKVWRDSDWQCRLVDTTTADVIAVPGSGGSPEAAIKNAIETLKDRNEYPRGGFIYYSLDSGGIKLNDKLTTSRWDKVFFEWFDKILFVVGSIVGVVLLLTPEPSGITKGLGLALLAVSVLRSGYAIYKNLSLGIPLIDQRNVLEALSILSAFLGIRGGRLIQTALKGEVAAAKVITSFRLGRGMMMASFATDAGTFVWAASDAMQQMEAAAQAGGDDAQREANFSSVVMRLAVQGLLLVGNARDVFRPMPGATGKHKTVAQALGAQGEIKLDPASRARIETDMRRMGFQDDTSRMSEGELVRQYAELQMAAARLRSEAAAAAETPATGGTAGRGGYDSQPTRHFEPGDVTSAMSSGFRKRAHVGTKVDQAKVEVRGAERVVVAPMNVEVAGHGKIVNTLEIRVVDDITAIQSPHDEGGWSRVSLAPRKDGTWVVSVAIDGRVGRAGGPGPDIRNVLGHAIDEAAIIITKSKLDPKLDVAAEHEGRIFVDGGDPAAKATAHDTAFAFEVSRVFSELPGWPDRLRIASDNLANHGTAIPADVLRIQQRVNSHLDTMGFRDPATREARIAALQRENGGTLPVGLADYIRGRYGQTIAAETRILATFGGSPHVITPDLVTHLMHAEGQTGAAFANMGLHGGHDQNALYAFVDTSTTTTKAGNTRQKYQVSVARERDLAGMKAKVHVQWERGASIRADVPPRDVTTKGATGATFDDVLANVGGELGWHRSNSPKTTVDRLDIFLREANQAFTAWAASPAAAALTGNEAVFGAVAGATQPAWVSANGVAFGGRAVRIGGAWRPTRLWLELSNFGL